MVDYRQLNVSCFAVKVSCTWNASSKQSGYNVAAQKLISRFFSFRSINIDAFFKISTFRATGFAPARYGNGATLLIKVSIIFA